jgi:uncharacterized protein (DUF488 family)
MTIQDTVFTIGHSTHPQEHFIALLRQHGITALCDVRSNPLSRVNPQFNLEELKKILPEHGTNYLFLGKELGARSDDPACYEGGKVQYDRLARTELFQQGLARIQDGMSKGFRIALMCAEKEPLECHRTILVARHLVALCIDVQHIHATGDLESHNGALCRLAHMVGVPDQDLFGRSAEELQDDTYRRQENRIAYELERASALDESRVFQRAVG